MPIIRREHDDDPDVQMTPIIDMVFLLLIFFLVTASLKKPIKVLPIELEPATYAKEQRLDNEVVISIERSGERKLWDGKTHLNAAAVGRGTLMDFLGDLSRDDPATPIRLDIDRNARWGAVMDLHNQLELYGLRRVFYKSAVGSGAQDEGN